MTFWNYLWKGQRAPAGKLARLQALIPALREKAARLQTLSNAALQRAACNIREDDPPSSQIQNQKHDLITAFALATEAVRRSTGKAYYDVQLLAGGVLAEGDLAEMKTGEGKTLVTLLPVFWSVLTGHRVHVATTNSYLAERDFTELEPAFDLLGVKAALLPEENHPDAKRSAYECDVTFGTGYEFGFDYLRDQITHRRQSQSGLGGDWLRSISHRQNQGPPLIQAVRQATIIDEIDSVLIDEANTPLVLSFGKGNLSPARREPYQIAARLVDDLVEGADYHVSRPQQQITITPPGLARGDQAVPANGTWDLLRPWKIYLEQALRAKHLIRRDVDYVVREGEIALVDHDTGRIFGERKWRDGLHQAVECLENVPLTAENPSEARISRQRFFQQYTRRTGMSGTAVDALDEFRNVFDLQVVPIPLNRACRRQHLHTRSFVHQEAKSDAIAEDVKRRRSLGQPVLVGTRTIEQSRQLSDVMKRRGISHQLLNGLQDAEEATIIAEAGQAAVVTIATNMAGRGTDIRLSKQAREAGGLHVIGLEHHRSRRVDQQLIGRAARQGDPGSSQFFVSADDELMVQTGASLARQIQRLANREGEALLKIEEPLRAVQQQAERLDFTRRQQLIRQELWMENVLGTLVGKGKAS